MVITITLDLDKRWDDYKDSLFAEDFMKDDISEIVEEYLNGVVVTDLKIVKK